MLLEQPQTKRGMTPLKFFTLLILFPTLLLAKDMDEQFAVYGVGAENCAAFLVARDQGGVASRWYFDWLGGYTSAVNTAAANTYDILGEKTLGDIVSWLEGYCATNPTMNFTNAVADLVTVIYEERSNMSPNKSGGWNKTFTPVSPGSPNQTGKITGQP